MSVEYRFVEHTADVAIEAHGADLAEAMAAVASGLSHLLAGQEVSGGEADRTISIEADDLEGLVVRFLSELIYRFDAEGEILCDFVVKLGAGPALQAACRSIPFDPDLHRDGTLVKGVSYHNLVVEEARPGEPARIWVLLDV